MNNPDAMFDLASTAGKSFLASSSARMIPGFEAAMVNLRGYFAVDNRYVQAKMGRILFPFLTKSWKRLVSVCEMLKHALDESINIAKTNFLKTY